ncbi:HNH endonuclease [bacterium]|nr:HNH endonuclease [bacterium]
MSSNIPLKDQKVLCTRSGNRCAMPECHKELVIKENENDSPAIIGEMAHIKGEKPGAPRYESNMTDKERNCYNNLILVCRNCHKMIDDQYNTYTIEKLYEIKKRHESWIIESTRKEVINVTFVELNVVTKYIVSGQFVPSVSYVLIPPRDKIKKNKLSLATEQLITMGMVQAPQVSSFIGKCPDVEFGERLREGFVVEYERLKNEEGLMGDDLFDVLLDFASGGSNDFKIRAGGLAVLVYLFEKCEVFEK